MSVITRILWTPWARHHIWDRHKVDATEVEEACFGEAYRFVGRDGCHTILGRTEAGRYLFIVIVSMSGGRARVVTARDMDPIERRKWARKGK